MYHEHVECIATLCERIMKENGAIKIAIVASLLFHVMERTRKYAIDAIEKKT